MAVEDGLSMDSSVASTSTAPMGAGAGDGDGDGCEWESDMVDICAVMIANGGKGRAGCAADGPCQTKARQSYRVRRDK